jgi:hypothetical protein
MGKIQLQERKKHLQKREETVQRQATISGALWTRNTEAREGSQGRPCLAGSQHKAM